MNIMAEIGLIFGICLAGVAVEAALPFDFPGSVISMVMLIVLLLTGVVKEKHISRVSGFFMSNMSIFFLPACIGIMEHFDVIGSRLLPLLGICVLTTPLIYVVTAWTVQGMMALRRRKKGGGRNA